MTSKYILIALTVICMFFIGTSFFTDAITKPLRNIVSMIVVPIQRGMNDLKEKKEKGNSAFHKISDIIVDKRNIFFLIYKIFCPSLYS